MAKKLTVLHTSDWHIGHQLYKRRRYDEFKAFFKWFIKTCKEKNVDVVLIAGDIFDTALPASDAQKMYYEFLVDLSRTCVRHIVITSGNHDSPAFLSAANKLLEMLNIHIISESSGTSRDELRILPDANDQPELIVCATPYLRERDLRSFEPGKTKDEIAHEILEAMRLHYRELTDYACSVRGDLKIPVIGMGHLFATGTECPDQQDALVAGFLESVPASIFPPELDYVALGHIHRPQIVGGKNHIRYSGSPIATNFDSAAYDKSMVLIEFEGRNPHIELLNVPKFQELVTLRGESQNIFDQIAPLLDKKEKIWLDIRHEIAHNESYGWFTRQIEELVKNSSLEVLNIQSRRQSNQNITAKAPVTLDELGPMEIFQRLLAGESRLTEKDKAELTIAFTELLQEHYAREASGEQTGEDGHR